MKKITIFLEGESELIFVYNLLFKIFDPDTTLIESIKLREDNNRSTIDKYSFACEAPAISFRLIQVGGDNKVLSQLKTNAASLLNKGYIVCGLRDLYCESYSDQAGKKINNAVSNKIITNSMSILKSVSSSKDLHIFFSIMEIEAWYLAFHNVLEKMGLAVAQINRILKLKLQEIDPETSFFKPKTQLKLIYEKIRKHPYKESHFAAAISKKITQDDIDEIMKSGRVKSFANFYNFLCDL